MQTNDAVKTDFEILCRWKIQEKLRYEALLKESKGLLSFRFFNLEQRDRMDGRMNGRTGKLIIFMDVGPAEKSIEWINPNFLFQAI